MRYEKPEIVVLGEAKTVVLGDHFSPDPENAMSSTRGELVGYDE